MSACLSKSQLDRGLVVDHRGKFLSMSACLRKSELGRGLVVDDRGKFLSMSACLRKSELGRGLVVDDRGKFLSMSACLSMLKQVRTWSWMIVENFKECQHAYACLSKSELGRGLVVDDRGKFLSMSACLSMLEQVRTWSWIGRG